MQVARLVVHCARRESFQVARKEIDPEGAEGGNPRITPTNPRSLFSPGRSPDCWECLGLKSKGILTGSVLQNHGDNPDSE